MKTQRFTDRYPKQVAKIAAALQKAPEVAGALPHLPDDARESLKTMLELLATAGTDASVSEKLRQRQAASDEEAGAFENRVPPSAPSSRCLISPVPPPSPPAARRLSAARGAGALQVDEIMNNDWNTRPEIQVAPTRDRPAALESLFGDSICSPPLEALWRPGVKRWEG